MELILAFLVLIICLSWINYLFVQGFFVLLPEIAGQRIDVFYCRAVAGQLRGQIWRMCREIISCLVLLPGDSRAQTITSLLPGTPGQKTIEAGKINVFGSKPVLKPEKKCFWTKTGIEAGKNNVFGPKPVLKPEKLMFLDQNRYWSRKN
jgi:hypothetical protein